MQAGMSWYLNHREGRTCSRGPDVAHTCVLALPTSLGCRESLAPRLFANVEAEAHFAHHPRRRRVLAAR
jgi:hypothetical protein